MVDRPPRRLTRRTPRQLSETVKLLPPSIGAATSVAAFRAEVWKVFNDLIEQTAPNSGKHIAEQLKRRQSNYTLNEIYRWATELDAVPLVTLVHPETRQQFTKDGARDLDVAPIINDAPTSEPLRPLSTDALQSAMRVARRYIADTLPKDDYGDTIQQAVLARIDAALKGAAK